MPLDLGDVDAFFDASMTATVRGKQYRFPPVAADLGLWARRVAVRRAELADASKEEQDAALEQLREEIGDPPIPDGMTMPEALLSPEMVAELLADKVPDGMIEHLSQVAFARIVGGDEVALAVARGEGNVAGPANRAERRAAAKAGKKATAKKAAPKAAASRATSTAAAATTPSPASGSGTSSRKATPAKKTASRGRAS